MAYDEALSIPTEESVKICLRTQQIIAYESGVTKTVDPFGGSYFIEWLTDRLEEQIIAKMEQIEKVWGGMPNAVISGFPQREVIDKSYNQEIDIESGKEGSCRAQQYTTSTTQKIRIQHPNEKASTLQKKRVKVWKRKRNQKAVAESLEKVRAAVGDRRTNMIPVLVEAVKNYATVGEITSAMKSVFGTYKDPGLVI